MSPWLSCGKTFYGPVGFRRGRRTQAFSFQVSSSMLQYEYKQTKVVGFLSYTYTPHAEKIERNVPGTSLFSDLCLATAVLKNPYLHSYRSVTDWYGFLVQIFFNACCCRRCAYAMSSLSRVV